MVSRAASPPFDVAHAPRDGQGWDLDGVAHGNARSRRGRRGVQWARGRAVLSGERPRGARILCSTRSPTSAGTHSATSSRSTAGTLIGYGGSEAMQSPRGLYSATPWVSVARWVSTSPLRAAFDRNLYPNLGLSRGMLFKREPFGVDSSSRAIRAVSRPTTWRRTTACTLARPSSSALSCLGASNGSSWSCMSRRRDPLHGKAHAQKTAILDVTSYRDWLTNIGDCPTRLRIRFQKTSQDFFALNIASLPARGRWNTACRDSWARPAGQRGGNRRAQRAVHLPFPRRQRVDRAAAGPQPRARRRPWPRHGGHRAGAVRLCAARHSGALVAPPPAQHGRAVRNTGRRRRRG